MPQELNELDCQVLVVGGSLVGLSAALFLHQQGVQVTVVERRSALSTHPRLQAASPRTMEILGALGLRDAIRAAETPNACYGNIIQAARLAGPETARLEGPFPHDTYGVSATGWTLIGQDRLEPILLEQLRAGGVPVLFEHDLVSFDQDADSVTARVSVRGSAPQRVRARYLVAADGHASTVREQLGIESAGAGTLGEQSVILFDADLEPHVAGREFFICFIGNDVVRGALGRLGPAPNTRWCLAPHLPPGRRIEDYSPDECAELIRAAVGDDGLAVTIESRTRWPIAAQVASRYNLGRVFLAGDTAHVMPPTGGYGGNMGISDAHNLAWKLGLVLRGAASTSLLDTYQSERHGVATFTMQQALLRFQQRSVDVEASEVTRADEATVIFGQHYHSQDDQLPAVETSFVDPRSAAGWVGTRAPHVRIARDGIDHDAHDIFNTGFVVLHGETSCDVSAALTRAGVRGRGVCLTSEANQANLPQAIQRYGVDFERGAVLVRPDGVIAWNTDELTDAGLDSALAACLRYPTEAEVRRAS